MTLVAGVARPAGQRGRTELADRVVHKIAARAAGEVPGVLGGLADPSRRSRAPQVSGHLRDGRASLRLILGCDYPAPVAEITRRVRERVTSRLAELADVAIADLDIVVDALGEPQVPYRRLR